VVATAGNARPITKIKNKSGRKCQTLFFVVLTSVALGQLVIWFPW
jgi:hypothetical protein